ncbi:MAG: hypothetical protein A2498_14910 [Lentisphaerae bacterium RIFOXYC12_FULL_60_16]|nr:MAG: hypothetical protein A2498_14910 [Lentisphaerae bacterium RIFOXYC12_FULL_60_16]OGV75099.1 MAG: hypothetical protein A2269_08560 [Lentisphaerae bacterium RIFOXYA12_FULL_60_10]OGV80377.1 MAG: hypothetical protein A2340_15245 [Lentisphaerae bacterium RIFOXYB12_FULL_60_10]
MVWTDLTIEREYDEGLSYLERVGWELPDGVKKTRWSARFARGSVALKTCRRFGVPFTPAFG